MTVLGSMNARVDAKPWLWLPVKWSFNVAEPYLLTMRIFQPRGKGSKPLNWEIERQSLYDTVFYGLPRGKFEITSQNYGQFIRIGLKNHQSGEEASLDFDAINLEKILHKSYELVSLVDEAKLLELKVEKGLDELWAN